MTKKFFYILVSVSLLALSGCSEKEKLKTINLSVAITEMKIGETVDVNVKTDPASIILEKDSYMVSGGDVTYANNKLSFSSKEVGDYEIYATQDDIKSNVILIKVKEEKEVETPILPSELVTVDEVLANPDNYCLALSIQLKGNLPQALIGDHAGNMVPVIWNEARDKFIIIEGNQPDFGNGPALLTGTISYNGYEYVINVRESSPLE